MEGSFNWGLPYVSCPHFSKWVCFIYFFLLSYFLVNPSTLFEIISSGRMLCNHSAFPLPSYSVRKANSSTGRFSLGGVLLQWYGDPSTLKKLSDSPLEAAYSAPSVHFPSHSVVLHSQNFSSYIFLSVMIL